MKHTKIFFGQKAALTNQKVGFIISQLLQQLKFCF